MFKSFNGETADSVWQAVASAFRSDPEIPNQHGRGGVTREMLHVGISIKKPTERWVFSRTPPINPAFALAEVIWIMAGRNDAHFMNFFNSKLPNYAGNGDTYHGAYGWRLRREHGVDQLERGFNALKNNPDSRQIVLQIWDALTDLPNEDGTAAAPDIPCNLISMLKIRGGALEWTQILRSNDLFLGLPYNIIQFTSLQEIMAGWLGLNVGSYNHLSDSLHVYAHSESAISASLPISIPIPNSDSLRLPKYESTKAFEELAEKVGHFILPQTKTTEILNGLRTSALTEPYKNILALICAEILRRRGQAMLSNEAIAECTNRLFVDLFSKWRDSIRATSLARDS